MDGCLWASVSHLDQKLPVLKAVGPLPSVIFSMNGSSLLLSLRNPGPASFLEAATDGVEGKRLLFGISDFVGPFRVRVFRTSAEALRSIATPRPIAPPQDL